MGKRLLYAKTTTRTILIHLVSLTPQNDESRIVRLYQYLGWPDDGVPASAATLLNLRSIVRSAKADSVSSAEDERPTLVMCRYDTELCLIKHAAIWPVSEVEKKCNIYMEKTVLGLPEFRDSTEK